MCIESSTSAIERRKATLLMTTAVDGAYYTGGGVLIYVWTIFFCLATHKKFSVTFPTRPKQLDLGVSHEKIRVL